MADEDEPTEVPEKFLVGDNPPPPEEMARLMAEAGEQVAEGSETDPEDFVVPNEGVVPDGPDEGSQPER